MFDVFIGWDSREEDAYRVCVNSIHRHISPNSVRIHPLKQEVLRKMGVYYRPRSEPCSVEFTYTRFLVPWSMKFNGHALFCDCDFLFNCNIEEIFDYADDRKAVHVVKHDYTPRQSIKMDGQKQVSYPRKNWSSCVLWNCGHPSNKALHVNRVNLATPSELHRFAHLDDSEIGELPLTYNWLEGEYDKPEEQPKVIHYTQGGPWFDDYKDCDYADEWREAARDIGMDY